MITSFSGENEFLSNFFPSTIECEGIVFPTVEHAFQAAKTLDMEVRKEFLTLTPGQAKRKGRKVALRSDWEEIKIELMAQLLTKKFAIPELREKLLATGNRELVEGNNWGDTFWGVDPSKGGGENHLGKLLMNVRDAIRLTGTS